MAYTAPTSADLIARYPAFAAVSVDTIEYWLDDAALECESYPDIYRARAEMAYAAHRMAELSVIDGVPQGVTSFESGDFKATISSGTADRTGYATTVYGRELDMFRRRAFGGPIPAWTPPTYV